VIKKQQYLAINAAIISLLGKKPIPMDVEPWVLSQEMPPRLLSFSLQVFPASILSRK
jgi:hypothetical protein